MSRHREDMDCKVFVGGLPNDATSRELEDAFERFGSVRKVWLARRPPGFAFIEFSDARDAEDAVKELNGSRICGVRARVELSHGGKRSHRSGRFSEGRGRGFGGGRGGGGRIRSRSPRYNSSNRSPSPRRSPRYDDDDPRDRRS